MKQPTTHLLTDNMNKRKTWTFKFRNEKTKINQTENMTEKLEEQLHDNMEEKERNNERLKRKRKHVFEQCLREGHPSAVGGLSFVGGLPLPIGGLSSVVLFFLSLVAFPPSLPYVGTKDHPQREAANGRNRDHPQGREAPKGKG